MTRKLTDREKKLLILLAVVLLVAGLGGGVIFPLLNRIGQVREEITQASLEKSEKEIKVESLPELESAVTAVESQLENARKRYHAGLLSKDVDEILTRTSQSYGLTVTGLTISMPEKGEQTLLAPYSGLDVQTESVEEAADEAAQEAAYTGFSTAEATLRVSGERKALQKLLDNLSGRCPSTRVDAFQWEESDGSSALSIQLELYMMRDTESYQQQQEAQ